MNTENMLCRTTPRIELLCKLCEPYSSVADVGCDHAYMAIHLARKNKKVIASDVCTGPLSKAKENVKRFGLEKNIELRLCNGLSKYLPGETEAVIIAGMGANVIAKIIDEKKDVAKSAKVLFLQPMTSPEVLRKYLYENNYEIKDEYLISEGRRIYTVIEAVYGNTYEFDEFDCHISRVLAKRISIPIYFEYVKRKHSEFLKIVSGLKISKEKSEQINYYEYLLKRTEKLMEECELK